MKGRTIHPVFPGGLLLILWFTQCSQQRNPSADTLPNVLLINVDDLGYGDLGAYGATMVRTPNIDRLASEGMRFTDFHSASAVCSPSRYALITGTYPFRINLFGAMFLRAPLVVDTAKMTVARVMKSAGYATAAVGKWHLGFGENHPANWNEPLKPGPVELGFESYFGLPVLNSHPPFVYVENHRVVGYDPDDPFIYGERSETRWFQEKFGLEEIGGARKAHFLYDDRRMGATLLDTALSFIRKPRDQPFFLYLATPHIHHPFTPDPRHIGSSEAGRYGDFIHELDWMVGEILRTLDEEGLSDNTLVMLTSDNGGMLNQGGQDAYAAGHRMNGDLLGFKFDAWEGGHRVPFLVRWPGKVPAGTVSGQLASNVDFLATLAALVEADSLAADVPDSRNMLPAMTGDTAYTIRDHLVIAANSRDHLSIRKGPWMYIPARGGGGFWGSEPGEHLFGGPAAFPFTGQKNSDIANGRIIENAPPGQLYHLEKDPSQQQNVYGEFQEIVRELETLLDHLKSSG